MITNVKNVASVYTDIIVWVVWVISQDRVCSVTSNAVQTNNWLVVAACTQELARRNRT